MLSSRLLRQTVRPPVLRSTARSPSSPITPRKRAFHATAHRQDVTSALLYLPHVLTTNLHEVLPWYAVLPLSALIVRGTVFVTVGEWSRVRTQRYLGTHPLRQARALRIQRDHAMAKDQSGDTRVKVARMNREVRKDAAAFDQRWECSKNAQLAWTFSTLPIYLVMTEVIRRMCNTREGILGMILKGSGLKGPDESVHGTNLGINPWFEPSLANEGALWFPDLLLPDPTGSLPCIVSALMLFNIINKGGKLRILPGDVSRLEKAVRYAMMAMSVCISFTCQSLPAAVMLYWAGSTTTAITFNWYLDKKYPMPGGLTRCKRPLQVMKPLKSSSARKGSPRIIALRKRSSVA